MTINTVFVSDIQIKWSRIPIKIIIEHLAAGTGHVTRSTLRHVLVSIVKPPLLPPFPSAHYCPQRKYTAALSKVCRCEGFAK